MEKDKVFINLLNRSLRQLLRDIARVTFAVKPAALAFVFKTVVFQWLAARRRNRRERQGVHIPPFMIVSITQKCNLSCRGCYAQMPERRQAHELDNTRLGELFGEAQELGVSIVIIAGGEPFLRPGFMDITKRFPRMLFPVFTNGTLIDNALLGQLARQRHVIPVVSIEGDEQATDTRRGAGVFSRVSALVRQLAGNTFWGISFTVTKENLATVTDPEYIEGFIAAGCKLLFFIEYIPVTGGTEGSVLENAQRRELLEALGSFRKRYPALFCAFPGDEEGYDGCLAAGRGFIHINPAGNVEPCPFSPYSDRNISNSSLLEALQSPLLAAIRGNHAILSETKGGCALWGRREWVKERLEAKK